MKRGIYIFVFFCLMPYRQKREVSLKIIEV